MFEEVREKVQKLTSLEFTGPGGLEGVDEGIGEAEVLAGLGRAPAAGLFLGHYTEAEIREHLERYGIMARLGELGYPEAQIEVQTRDVFSHRLFVFFERRDYEHMLIELRLREGWFRPKDQFVEGFDVGAMALILVDWLMLQDPGRRFEAARPALPEQRYPGLGLLASLIPLVHEVVKETGREGVLDVPEHYHGALFYSKWFRFYNPEIEGRFLAMRRDLGSLPLHQVSHGFDLNCVMETGSGKYAKWVPGEQIMPIGEGLAAYYNHPGWAAARDRALEGHHYELDQARLERKTREREEEDRAKSGPAVERRGT